MTKQTWGLNASLYDYYQAIAFREPDILKELRQATSQLPMANMQIAPEQGQFMALLVQLTGARKILEIGVFTGYSSLAMALALPPRVVSWAVRSAQNMPRSPVNFGKKLESVKKLMCFWGQP